MVIFLIILQALFFGLITAFLAGQKGYDIYTFYVVGLILGPIGVLSAFLPKQRETTVIHEELGIDLIAA